MRASGPGGGVYISQMPVWGPRRAHVREAASQPIRDPSFLEAYISSESASVLVVQLGATHPTPCSIFSLASRRMLGAMVDNQVVQLSDPVGCDRVIAEQARKSR